MELEFGYPHDILIGTEGHCFLTLRVFEDHFEVSAWVKMECCLKKRSKKGVTMRSKRRFGAIRMMKHFNAFMDLLNRNECEHIVCLVGQHFVLVITTMLEMNACHNFRERP